MFLSKIKLILSTFCYCSSFVCHLRDMPVMKDHVRRYRFQHMELFMHILKKTQNHSFSRNSVKTYNLKMENEE